MVVETPFGGRYRRRSARARTDGRYRRSPAIDRGEVAPDIDTGFVLDAVAGPIYFRALFRHLPLPGTLADQPVDTVLAAIRRKQ